MLSGRWSAKIMEMMDVNMYKTVLKAFLSLMIMVNLTAEDMPPEYEFINAVHWNKLPLVKKELPEGTDINAKIPDGSTAGHAAADRCNLSMIKFLSGKKLKLNEVNAAGETPL